MKAMKALVIRPIWEKSIPGRENSKDKGLKAGILRNSRKTVWQEQSKQSAGCVGVGGTWLLLLVEWESLQDFIYILHIYYITLYIFHKYIYIIAVFKHFFKIFFKLFLKWKPNIQNR